MQDISSLAKTDISSFANRNVYVDFLRGLSIAIVLLAHGLVPHSVLSSISSSLSETIFRNGYYGVVVFFVVSGYLITSKQLERYTTLSSIDMRQFYVMRFARIIPCFILATSLIWLCFFYALPEFVPADRTLVSQGIYKAITLQYHTFFIKGAVPGMNTLSIFWSLSIEEVFYLTFPIICLFCVTNRVMVCVLIALVIYAPIYRSDFSDVFSWWGAVDLLAMGCLTAIFSRHITKHQIPIVIMKLLQIIGLGIIFYSLMFISWEKNVSFGPTIVGIGAVLFIIGSKNYISHTKYNRIFHLPLSGLAWLGSLSYELYLFHLIILYVLTTLFLRLGFNNKATPFIIMSIAIMGGYLIAKFYSEPLNRKIRMFYKKYNS